MLRTRPTLAVLEDRVVLATLVVSQAPGATGDYSTIQAAVDAAEPDDSIEVLPGTYQEEVFIDTSGIDLYSAEPNQAIIEAPSSSDPAVYISTALNVTVQGFTITGPAAYGVWVANSPASANVLDNQISGAGYGIRMEYAGGDVSGNQVSGYQSAGISILGTGVDSTVSDNTVTGLGEASGDVAAAGHLERIELRRAVGCLSGQASAAPETEYEVTL